MSAQPKPQPGFIIIWEFRPQPEKRREFEEAYGPEGNWARVLRRGNGYVRTELHADTKSPGRYFTLDFWESRAEFETFKQSYSEEYKAMDAKCESLTMEEKFLGFCHTREQVRALLSAYGAEISEVVPQTVVRAATQADIQTMLLLQQATPSAAHWSEKTYQEIFDPLAPTRLAFVAQNTAGTLLGFVVARLSGDECELESIVVTPRQQGRGIGHRLLRLLIDAARAKKAGRMFLEVRDSKFAARTLYERSGFVIAGRRSSYYGAPQEDALLYELKL